jgi:protocatechuate 3,4-dioxygenase beta subunit
MNILIYKLSIMVFLAACGQRNANVSLSQSAYQDTCDNPDANINCCFSNTPANLKSVMTIAAPIESGERLIVSGTIFKADSRTPYPDVVLYAYHTDAKGHYSKTGKEVGVQKWHGRLHGWCRTDSNGHYEIRSIRPARYPDNSMPAHIHIAVKEPKGKEPFYISDVVFKDDALVNERYLQSINAMVGGTGVVALNKSSDGTTWNGHRDIVLPK